MSSEMFEELRRHVEEMCRTSFPERIVISGSIDKMLRRHLPAPTMPMNSLLGIPVDVNPDIVGDWVVLEYVKDGVRDHRFFKLEGDR